MAGAENRYRALLDASLGIVWRCAPDMSVIEAWGWDKITGQAMSEYSGSGWLDAVHPDDHAEITRVLEQAPALGRPCEATYRTRLMDGQYRWVPARMVPLRNKGGNIREWMGNLVDVHDKIETDVALSKAMERLRLALESSSLGVWDYDFRSKIGWWSEAKREVLGLPEDYPISEQSFLALVHPEDRPDVKTRIARAMPPSGDGLFEAEYRVRRAHDGSELWLASCGQVYFDHSGAPLRIIGTMRNVTTQRATQQKLQNLAHFDQLTGLVNRVNFTRQIEAAIKASTAGAVILLDLDGFKNVNDTAGHHAGDLLLRAVASRLSAVVPPASIVSRWGGDEFALFVRHHIESLDLDKIVSGLKGSFDQPFMLPGREVFLSASFGIAVAPEHGISADELVANADLALYRAKAEGCSVGLTFRPEFKQELQSRVDLEADLRRAFSCSKFELHYQPQIRLSDGAVVGAEALLRWRHPQKGLLTPHSFLPVLKTSPIAGAVAEWILESACTAAARLRHHHQPIRIGVNVMSVQLRSGGFGETVRRCLADNMLLPELLELEITENIILKGDAGIVDMLRELRELGVGIAFDDYGTGYASLSMLTDYPLTRLKIDRAFIQRITTGGGDVAVVKAIVNLGQGFGLGVTAEGIETEEQAQAVCALGVDEGQGYLYGRPVPLERLIERLDLQPKPPPTVMSSASPRQIPVQIG